MSTRAHRLAFCTLACSLALASCAPPPPGSIESLESSSRRGAERRERRYASADARGILRIDGHATGRLPGVSLRVRVASPDRARVQVGWLLGTLADLALRSDSLVVWIPGQRLGVLFGGLADTLGVREPARFLAQALSASWVAPHSAWRQAALDSSGAQLEWPGSAGETWTMHVDRDGRPTDVRVARAGRSVTAKVVGWLGRGPDARPSRLEIADGEGRVRARLELEELRAVKRPRASWFALMPPADARTLTLADLRELWSDMGERR